MTVKTDPEQQAARLKAVNALRGPFDAEDVELNASDLAQIQGVLNRAKSRQRLNALRAQQQQAAPAYGYRRPSAVTRF